MNSTVRRFLQRTVEFPLFRQMGLTDEQRDILEIGCGSGYGAVLLAALAPRSYIGIDLMPEQIDLAQQRHLAQAEFRVQDATDLSCFAAETKDIVVVFGMLHHIPNGQPLFKNVIAFCDRAANYLLRNPTAD